MKKLFIIAVLAIAALTVISCGGPRRDPGRAYMPDMAHSRAYETYADHSKLDSAGVNYTARPVEGTIARGDMTIVYPYKNDSSGQANSVNVKNPVAREAVDMTEAKRLYLVNCGICHGTKLDGNGPLYNNGDGPYPSKPANLKTDAKYIAMPDGRMFHSITYGFNAMGGYASQVTAKQRWEIIHYIRSEQGANAAAAPAAGDTAKAAVPVAVMPAAPKATK